MLFTGDLSKMPVEAESRVIVRFQDCDPLMHLNNSKYFEYFFNAREDQVSKLYGFSFEAMFRELKTSWVVYQHQIAYVRPALISEWTRITSRVIHYNEDTMVTEYFMTNDQRTELKTMLWTTSKHISILTGKRVPHNDEVMAYLAATCVPNIDFPNLQFNERIHEIKYALSQGTNA
ncbi:acyl-CoA thioesterase [Dyadobacter subterraneus]|uniref:Acyl-CoA thioesterase n=1 Tax=Dyadobacter subterraneus TaxID=2773304 RepID=A0ABR9W569_9BACT|nr:acyl-CoA thioesterase [Dyadobacter subterraneus]MBE9460607.1 acyl-CoA thioesterase [Dyadobacter subterraneus]